MSKRLVKYRAAPDKRSSLAITVMLYKFTISEQVARLISLGFFRFYDLTKYIRIEDDAGRSDPGECSVSFDPDEYLASPEKLPTASFNGVEFKCVSAAPDELHISQYFVFCMSTESNPVVMGDATHIVELHKDIFETIGLLLNEVSGGSKAPNNYRIYSHGAVMYYDIDNHPPFIGDDRWRESYLKHSKFKHQSEYRAVLFAHESMFGSLSKRPFEVSRPVYQNGCRCDFDLKLFMQSGVDAEGWRYIEIDISEFSAYMIKEPCNIVDVGLLRAGGISERDG